MNFLLALSLAATIATSGNTCTWVLQPDFDISQVSSEAILVNDDDRIEFSHAGKNFMYSKFNEDVFSWVCESTSVPLIGANLDANTVTLIVTIVAIALALSVYFFAINKEMPLTELYSESAKPNKTATTVKTIVETAKPKTITETSKPKTIVETSKPKTIVETAKPKAPVNFVAPLPDATRDDVVRFVETNPDVAKDQLKFFEFCKRENIKPMDQNEFWKIVEAYRKEKAELARRVTVANPGEVEAIGLVGISDGKIIKISDQIYQWVRENVLHTPGGFVSNEELKESFEIMFPGEAPPGSGLANAIVALDSRFSKANAKGVARKNVNGKSKAGIFEASLA